jgi:hypothetical protein
MMPVISAGIVRQRAGILLSLRGAYNFKWKDNFSNFIQIISESVD